MTCLSLLNFILFFGELSTSLTLSCVFFILIVISTVVQFVVGEIEIRKVKTILLQLQNQRKDIVRRGSEVGKLLFVFHIISNHYLN